LDLVGAGDDGRHGDDKMERRITMEEKVWVIVDFDSFD
jgi:hypothetical protein